MDFDEKYRPKTFDDMVGQERVVNYYRKWKEANGKPKHAIFRGRCGIGKTSMANVIENEFGVIMMNINGSADRSLTYFRDRLIPTMKVSPFSGKFRFIYIDETENMLNEAWMVLKTPLEKYKHNAVVVFSCNDDKNIPEAIRSRCEVFDFTTIGKNDIKKRLHYIAEQEKLEVSDEVIETISEKARGDLRKAVTLLEDYSKKAFTFGKNEFDDMFVLTG
jgi:replication factor C small subunit